MRRALLSALAAASLSTAALGGELQATSARVSFDGTSSVRAWSCAVKTVDAKISVHEQPTLGLDTLATAVAGGTVRIAVPALDCQNGTMNDHLRGALKAREHSTLVFRFQSAPQVRARTGEEVPVRVNGELTLAGTTRPITLELRARQEGQTLVVTGQHALTMTEWGVRPPSLMFGAMTVGAVVTVKLEVRFPVGPVSTVVGTRGPDSWRAPGPHHSALNL